MTKYNIHISEIYIEIYMKYSKIYFHLMFINYIFLKVFELHFYSYILPFVLINHINTNGKLKVLDDSERKSASYLSIASDALKLMYVCKTSVSH